MSVVPTIALLVSWLLALIFAVSVRHKLASWPRFKASFAAYEIVPERLLTPAAIFLVICEALVVVGCLLAQAEAIAAAAAMLLVFALAMTINLVRGRRYIDCGCGDEPTPIGLGLLLRNGVLFGMAVAAAGSVPGFEAPGAMLFIAAVGAAIAYGIYATVEQLLVNRGRHQRLWLGAS